MNIFSLISSVSQAGSALLGYLKPRQFQSIMACLSGPVRRGAAAGRDARGPESGRGEEHMHGSRPGSIWSHFDILLTSSRNQSLLTNLE